MRKIFLLILVFGMMIACAGVVMAEGLDEEGPGGDTGPVADFSFDPSNGPAPLAVSFTDTSTGSPTTYEWDFGDGGDTSILSSPTHTFSEAKTYTIRLTVTRDGLSNSTSKTLIVSPAPVAPIAEFSFTPSNGPAPLEVSFTDTSTGSPTTYEWDFGDGGDTSILSSPTHTFSEAKTYTIHLTVTRDGLSNSTSKTLTVSPALVAPTITSLEIFPNPGVVSSPVKFTAQVTGSPTTYEWDFGDGNTQSGDSPTIQHTYNSVKNYTAKLTVKNSKGNATKTVDFAVKDNGVSISTNVTSGKVPLTVNFTAITNFEVGDNKGFEWDLHPNETPKSGKSVTYTYEKPGEYTVTLRVYPAIGGSPIEKTVTIKAEEDVLDASFTASALSGTAPLPVVFTDTSNGATSWTWSIYKTDGGSPTLQTPELTNRNISYTFQNAGTYKVELTAKKGSNTSVETKTIIVNARATTAPTTVATTPPTTAAAVAQNAEISDEDILIPNPIDVIGEFFRLLFAMMDPGRYNLEPPDEAA